MDGQTEVVNKCIETYLRCMTGDLPRSWSSWVTLAEFWYNTNFHSTISMTPFQALYGVPPPRHLPYFPKDPPIEVVNRLLQDREAAIQLMKHSLSNARQKMMQQANKHRTYMFFFKLVLFI